LELYRCVRKKQVSQELEMFAKGGMPNNTNDAPELVAARSVGFKVGAKIGKYGVSEQPVGPHQVEVVDVVAADIILFGITVPLDPLPVFVPLDPLPVFVPLDLLPVFVPFDPLPVFVPLDPLPVFVPLDPLPVFVPLYPLLLIFPPRSLPTFISSRVDTAIGLSCKRRRIVWETVATEQRGS
jgi:hypothetical protein